MNLAPVVERLKAETGSTFRVVGRAAELNAALEAGVPATPAVYVIPLAEQAGDEFLLGVTAQRIQARFGVLLLVRNAADGTRGSATLDDLEPLRGAVRSALHGWAPGGAGSEPCLFESGELLSFEPGALSWLDTWRTAEEWRTTQ